MLNKLNKIENKETNEVSYHILYYIILYLKCILAQFAYFTALAGINTRVWIFLKRILIRMRI